MGKMTVNGMARRIAGLTEDPDKTAALAEYLGITPNEIIHLHDSVYKVIASGDEYVVCKDDAEADRLAYESVKNVLDECGYYVVKGFEKFDDEDSLIQYVIENDGRGPQLASYDGNEIEIEFEGDQYYIYRVN